MKEICILITILALTFVPVYAIEIVDILDNPTEENINLYSKQLTDSTSQLSKGVLGWARWVSEFILDLLKPSSFLEDLKLLPHIPEYIKWGYETQKNANSIIEGLLNIREAIKSWGDEWLNKPIEQITDWERAQITALLLDHVKPTQAEICAEQRRVKEIIKKIDEDISSTNNTALKARLIELKSGYQSYYNSLSEVKAFVDDLDNQLTPYYRQVANGTCFRYGCTSGYSCGGGGDGNGGPPPGNDHPDETTAIGEAIFEVDKVNARAYQIYLAKVYERSPDMEFHRQIENISWNRLNSSWNASDVFWENLENYLALSKNVINDFESGYDIAVLKKGFYSSTNKLLNSVSELSLSLELERFVSNDYPDYTKVLIIPTGGLYGLESDEIFKARLEKFVSEGGILIVFAQQHGYEFQALPGGEVSGYGWLEDQSCFSRAVYIDTYHPVLAGQDSVLMDINIDGYFTSWPENATVLFSRTANGMPAGIMYRYGKGWVVATTAYTDWALAHGQRTGDGLAFVRDLLAWAVAESEGMEIPEYGHGDTANISVTITNRANSTATGVVFSVIDPNKNIVSNFSVPVIIALGETKTVYASYLIRSESGIWSVDYALVNATNETIQVGYDVARFVMKRVQNMSNKEFQSWITKRFYTLSIKKVEGSSKGVIE